MTRHQPSLVITGHDLDFRDLARAAAGTLPVSVAPSAFDAIKASRAIVETILKENRPAYGITTGVGSQKDFKVDPASAAAYNARLVAAHATRVPGPTLPANAVRGAMIYLANQFAAFARDPSQGMEVAFEAGHWVLRPSPDFLAALASLRAIRGLKS